MNLFLLCHSNGHSQFYIQQISQHMVPVCQFNSLYLKRFENSICQQMQINYIHNVDALYVIPKSRIDWPFGFVEYFVCSQSNSMHTWSMTHNYQTCHSRIDWSFGLCWVLRLAAFVYFHAHMKQDTQMPNMTFHIILMGVWIPFKCSRTECIQLIRADSTSDYSTQYCFNRLQMNMVRYLENRADHPNKEGVSWVCLNRIDYSWQISSRFCLRNYYTVKENPNVTVILRHWTDQFNSHGPTLVASIVYLSNHERPTHFADVRILHGLTAWIWPNVVWFWKSAASNYDPQKHESEPNMYVVCCGQTYLTRVTDWLRYTGLFVW